uniref:Lipocalin/cytosolic fatty-acid binding domain-containing protein n=1 Tax=Phlebotomus papatasi TaxID=29031 RepID=A0A1B0GQ06_PHLPP
MPSFPLFFILILLTICPSDGIYRIRRRERCPKVKAMRNFELSEMMGYWYVIQYFASTEEAPEYSCMRSIFDFSYEDLTVSFFAG